MFRDCESILPETSVKTSWSLAALNSGYYILMSARISTCLMVVNTLACHCGIYARATTHTYIHIYVYIYRERERKKERYVCKILPLYAMRSIHTIHTCNMRNKKPQVISSIFITIFMHRIIRKKIGSLSTIHVITHGSHGACNCTSTSRKTISSHSYIVNSMSADVLLCVTRTLISMVWT